MLTSVERPSQSGLPLKLSIIGDGSAAYRARLADLARAAAGPRLTVELTGKLPANGVRNALAGAHLFVHPSRLPEGLPRVLVEALAAGTPVIASDSGGQSDILEHGRWGALYPAGDVKALAGAIRTALAAWQRDPHAVRAAASTARAHALEQFSFERFVAGHLEDLTAARESQQSGPEFQWSGPPFQWSGPPPQWSGPPCPRGRDSKPSSAGSLAEIGPAIEAFTHQLVRAALVAARTPDALADDALFRIAVVLKRGGQAASAVEMFQCLYQRGGEAALRRAAFHLGELALLHGDWPAAETWFGRCLAAAPDHRKADDGLAAARARRVPAHLRALAATTADNAAREFARMATTP